MLPSARRAGGQSAQVPPEGGYSRILRENAWSSCAPTRYAPSTSAPQLLMPPTPRMAPHTVTTVRTGLGSSSRWAAWASCQGVWGRAEKAKGAPSASSVSLLPSRFRRTAAWVSV